MKGADRRIVLRDARAASRDQQSPTNGDNLSGTCCTNRDSGPEILYLEGSNGGDLKRSGVVSIRIGEQLGWRQSPGRSPAVVSDRSTGSAAEPVPRIALTQQEGRASLGCGEDFLAEHVKPRMRVVRRGYERLFPPDELTREAAEYALCTGRIEP